MKKILLILCIIFIIIFLSGCKELQPLDRPQSPQEIYIIKLLESGTIPVKTLIKSNYYIVGIEYKINEAQSKIIYKKSDSVGGNGYLISIKEIIYDKNIKDGYIKVTSTEYYTLDVMKVYICNVYLPYNYKLITEDYTQSNGKSSETIHQSIIYD